MQEIRCIKCNKLLFKVSDISGTLKTKIEIKCSKCKKINSYKLEVLETQRKQVG